MIKKNKTKRNQKNNHKMTFKRWGTLVPQEHHCEPENYSMYHNPPVKMGIFAFPEKFASRQDVSDPCAAWLDDENRYPVTVWRDRLGTFSYGGSIWHHLEFTNNWDHWIRTDDGIKADIQWAYNRKEEDENYDLEGALNRIIAGQYGEIYYDYEADRKIKRLVKPEDIIRRSGSWILTDMRTYKKALEKAEHIAKYEEFTRMKAKGEVEGFPMGLPKREIHPTLFEVYIEKVE